MPLSPAINFGLTIMYSGFIAGLCDSICQGLEMQVTKKPNLKGVPEDLTSDDEEEDEVAIVKEEAKEAKDITTREQKYDWKRTARYVVCPGFMAGIASYIEIILLLGQTKSNDWLTVLMKTLIDVTLYYPILITGGFVTNLLLDCKDWDYMKIKFQQDFLHTWAAAAILWAPVDIVVFKVVPVQWQVYVVKTVDIVALLGFSYFVNKHPLVELAFTQTHGGTIPKGEDTTEPKSPTEEEINSKGK